MFAALLPILGPIIGRLIDLIPDPNARAKAQAEAQAQLLAVLAKADNEQAETNKAEAASASVFVAGWRPAIGWVCAISLFYQYIGRALITALFDAMRWPAPVLLGLDDNLWQLMLGMLGMGGLRTFEKLKGVTK
ncbi:MAG: hypothetical protein HYR63_07695 [Proteobacteria bacterium]|nr:hypothetical protein [Pseudomonadota bacterium]